MIKTPPRGGMDKAVELCMQFDGFLLFPEQRVGKTWIALSVADRRKPRHLIIMTRKVAIGVWESEIEKHLKLDWKCDIQIMTHEAFAHSGAKQLRKYLKKCTRDDVMIILDESHKVKRRGSKQSRAIRQIAKHYARYRIAMTGTPIGKGIENAWAQMDFVDPTVFGTFEQFEQEYLIMGGFRGKKVVGHRNLDRFREVLASRSFRVTLQEIRKDKYKVQNCKRYFDLPPEARKLYDDLESGLDVILLGRTIKLKELFHSATKRQQLTGGFLIRGTDENGEKLPEREILPVHTAGLDLLRRLLRLHIGERIVISAKYSHELRAIRTVCRGLGLTTKTIKGGKPYDGKFNRDVVIIQTQSGIAIDLSESSIAMFYSMDYSFIINAQMRSRLLSFTKKFIRCYYLLGRNTIAEEVYEAWRTNRKLSDVILDNWRRRNP